MTIDKKKLSSEKVEALQLVMIAIEKSSARVLGENQEMRVKMISTGSLALDISSGGGLPINRITEIYRPESSGNAARRLIGNC